MASIHTEDCSVLSNSEPAIGYIAKHELGEYHIQEQQNTRCRMSLGR